MIAVIIYILLCFFACRLATCGFTKPGKTLDNPCNAMHDTTTSCCEAPKPNQPSLSRSTRCRVHVIVQK